VSKVEEKSKPVAAPVVAATAPSPTPAVVETPKPAQAVESQVATGPESKDHAVAKTSESPKVEAAAAPQNGLFSSRNIAIASVTFTLLVCALLIRSGRNARRASLITRSLERERE
jgi:hypothetical protein